MNGEHVEMACAEVDELSGLYVLDALDAAEAAAVRRHLATCSEAHAAFADVAAVMPALNGLIDPVRPPAELRDRVLAAVAATPQAAAPQAAMSQEAWSPVPVTGRAPSAMPAPSAVPSSPSALPSPSARPSPSPVPISLAVARERRASRVASWWRPAMAAAAVLLIVVLGGLNLVLERRASDAEARASVLRSAIAVSLDPNSQVAGLHGSGVAAGATGFAAFPKTGTGYIVVNGLPQVTSDKTYQAWFVTGGTAHSAGLLTPDSDGLSVLQGVAMTPGAELVALTIEPAGGMPAPTTDPIVVGEMQPGPVAVAFPKLGSLSGG